MHVTKGTAMRLLISAMAFAIASPTLAMADSQTTLEKTKTFFSALESGTLEDIESFLDEDVVNTIPYAATGETSSDGLRIYDGRDEVMAYFAGARERIAEVMFVDHDITVSEDGRTVFAQNRGNMVLADGREYENLYVWRIDYSDGQIAAITEYFNPVTAAIAFNRPIGPQPTD